MISLETLERFEPHAEFTLSGHDGCATPHLSVKASMKSTNQGAAGKGFGGYVKYDDVLHLLCVHELRGGKERDNG